MSAPRTDPVTGRPHKLSGVEKSEKSSHMRQGQNSKRSRGRGRKPQNSANRSYESNGPDVKIRGTAAHVCEKYQQLARDAISAGDRVTAENYFQHAEHYYRLLMAAQTGQEGNRQTTANLGYRPNDEEEEEFESSNESAESNGGSGDASAAKGDGQDEDAGRDKKSAASGSDDESQPRRRQNRRRRPRTEARDGAGEGAEKSGGESRADGASGKSRSKSSESKSDGDSGSDAGVGADGAAA